MGENKQNCLILSDLHEKLNLVGDNTWNMAIY